MIRSSKKLKFSVAIISTVALTLFVALFTNNTNTSAIELSSAQAIDADVVQHLAKERGITLSEAETRISWQDRAYDLNEELDNKLSNESFGGVWVNKDNDRIQIGMLNNTRVSGVERALLVRVVADSKLTDATDYISVERSYQDLKTAQSWISNQAQLSNGTTQWPIQVGIVTDQNKVMMHVPSDLSKLTSALASLVEDVDSKYGDMVTYKYYDNPPVLQSCNWWFCDSPLRGGVGLHGSANGYQQTVCTLGFNVLGNSGQKYALTAGHCGYYMGSGWGTSLYNYSFKQIGSVHRNEYLDGTDGMIIKIEPAYNWVANGWVYVRAGVGWNGYSGSSLNEQYDITASSTSGSLVGERVCVSGAISSAFEGGSCGAVHEVDVDFTSDGITTYHLVRAGYCSRAGDSGAPVFRLGKALGVHTGAGSPQTICSDEKYYTGIVPIIRSMDYTFDVF